MFAGWRRPVRLPQESDWSRWCVLYISPSPVDVYPPALIPYAEDAPLNGQRSRALTRSHLTAQSVRERLPLHTMATGVARPRLLFHHCNWMGMKNGLRGTPL